MSDSVIAAKGVVFSFLSNVLNLLNGVVLSIIIARYLGPTHLGSFHLVTWTLTVALLFVNLGIVMSLKKHVAEYQGRGDLRSIAGIINFMVGIRIVAALAVTLVLIFFSGPIARFFGVPESQAYYFWASLSILPGALGEIFGSGLAGIQKYHYSVLLRLIIAPLGFGLSLYVLMAGYGVYGLLIVNALTAVLSFIGNFWAARREKLIDPSVRLDEATKKGITRFNLGVTFMNFLDAVVWQRSEVFFLGRFRSIQEVGFYSLAYGFTTTSVSFFSLAIINVLIPIHSKAFGSNDRKVMETTYRKSVQFLSLVSLPVAVGGAVLADRFVTTLYGADFLPSATVMAILFVSAAGSQIGAAFAAVMYSSNMVHIKVYTAVIWATINISLDLLLIPKYGPMGAAIANTATQVMGITAGPFIIYYLFRFAFPVSAFLKVVASALTMGAGVWFLKGFFPGTGGLLALVCVGALFYLVSVIAFRAVVPNDIELFKRVGNSLPGAIQGKYRSVMNLVSRAVS